MRKGSKFWTPDSLRQVVGHDEHIEKLREDIEKGELSYNCLFQGPPGVGKSVTAEAIAEAVVQNPMNYKVYDCGKGKPSEVLESIRDRKNHNTLNYRDQNIVVLEEFDTFNEDNQKMFKMTLEETIGDKFIIITNYPERIEKPIRSRFETFKFSKLSKQELKKLARIIAEDKGVNPSEKFLETIAEQADGDARFVVRKIKDLVR